MVRPDQVHVHSQDHAEAHRDPGPEAPAQLRVCAPLLGSGNRAREDRIPARSQFLAEGLHAALRRDADDRCSGRSEEEGRGAAPSQLLQGPAVHQEGRCTEVRKGSQGRALPLVCFQHEERDPRANQQAHQVAGRRNQSHGIQHGRALLQRGLPQAALYASDGGSFECRLPAGGGLQPRPRNLRRPRDSHAVHAGGHGGEDARSRGQHRQEQGQAEQQAGQDAQAQARQEKEQGRRGGRARRRR
mmetsp:Transcript_10845/g.19824  ORF Transcript_10845/g.19824 Transcript_10845/m.19824 type:complete len:244 (-) Transcript_10845:1918-2649(-)